MHAYLRCLQPHKMQTSYACACRAQSTRTSSPRCPSSHRGEVEPKATRRTPAPDERTLLTPYEHKPHFHEWATALPGMICVSRKARNSTFRNYVAAETATPVRSRLEHSYANRA